MGAQKTINSLLGAAATAAVASEYAGEKGLLAKEQYHEAGADIIKLTGEQQEAKAALDKAEKALGRTKEGSKANLARLTEKEAAERAFQELSDRILAKQAMQSRAEKIMKRTGTWGGVK